MVPIRRFALLSLALLVLAACSTMVDENAPGLAAQFVPGEYIVVLNDDFAPGGAAANRAQAADIARGLGLAPQHTYGAALFGFSAGMSAGRAAALANDPRVAYVEQVMVQSIDVQSVPTGIDRAFASGNTNLKIDGSDDWRVDVDVAVIDTGVDFEHPDLDVVGGVDCAGGGPFGGSCGSGGDDDHYHGTHVAGTIAALDNGIGVVGVAPGARIWAVKVLNQRGSGYTSWIVAGIDWVAANAATIEVANMSLGGSGFSQAEYDAIQGAVNAGVAFAVAAGNSDADANNYSPAAFDNVLTVSALADFDGVPGGLGSPTCRSDVDDTLANFSNWGPAVDIAAPGVCILSTFPIEQGSYDTISGTSMASPHAAGALALLASNNNPGNAAAVYSLYNQLIAAGNLNWTDDSGDGIKERLLDVSGFNATMESVSGNTAPTAAITAPADGSSSDYGTSITFTGTADDTEDGDISGSISWSSDIEGGLGSGASVTATLNVGTHTITASVTDSGSMSGFDSITVTVNATGGNNDPVVEITGPADGTTVTDGDSITFTGTVSDAEEGDISGSISWSSDRDGGLGSGDSISTSDLSVGTHTITASVTDSGGLEGSDTITVTVDPLPGAITLSASGYKVKGVQHADLSWSGTTVNVDVYRQDIPDPLDTNIGQNPYADIIGNKGGGSYTYWVCETGTQTCSNTATVTF
ncbi:MAG: S8 family serine peptidase [Trueperaceae bacterium]|nr:MAG: S8 family serine peptidase [Trueperaceae bacterium]